MAKYLYPKTYLAAASAILLGPTSDGRLYDGFEWRWIPASSEGPFLVRQTTPGRLPPFIISLLPEGWLEHVLQDRDGRAMLKSGKRYMSNLTIVDDQRDLATLPSDILVTPLSAFSDKGVFTGKPESMLAPVEADTPRLSMPSKMPPALLCERSNSFD